MNTDYASLHAGKYDADDTYGLVAFDPTIGPTATGKPRSTADTEERRSDTSEL